MLFDELKIREVTFKNRIVVSPMCQYSSDDGFANDWHMVHLGSRAVGGASLVFTEAAAVEARGRISPQDLGIWKDEHIPALKRITDFIVAQGGVAGIQLAHAGRKASTAQPWQGGNPISVENGGWSPVIAPSAIAFDEGSQTPQEMSAADIRDVTQAFAAAAIRAQKAGFQVLEIHAAHGYLINEFLSPLSNKRTDEYGGSLENRARILFQVVAAVRAACGEAIPLFVRISATDWVAEGGWSIDDSVVLSRQLATKGVDLIDCSSGGVAPKIRIPTGPGYQTQFAERIRREGKILTGAVGMITNAEQADTILRTGQADLVFLAREFLRDPYFALHAAPKLGLKANGPKQYGRAL